MAIIRILARDVYGSIFLATCLMIGAGPRSVSCDDRDVFYEIEALLARKSIDDASKALGLIFSLPRLKSNEEQLRVLEHRLVAHKTLGQSSALLACACLLSSFARLSERWDDAVFFEIEALMARFHEGLDRHFLDEIENRLSSISVESAFDPRVAEAWLFLSKALRLLGRSSESRSFLDRAEEISMCLDDDGLRFDVLDLRFDYARSRGRHVEAMELLMEAREHAATLETRARSLFMEGLILGDKGHFFAAEDLILRALCTLGDQGLDWWRLRFTRTLGDVAFGSGRIDDAIDRYASAERQAMRLGMFSMAANSRGFQLRCNLALDRKDQADEDLSALREIVLASPGELSEAELLESLGYCQELGGRLVEASNSYIGAADVFRQWERFSRAAFCCLHAASCLRKSGDLRECISVLLDPVVIKGVREIKAVGPAAYDLLAAVYFDLGEIDRSITILGWAVDAKRDAGLERKIGYDYGKRSHLLSMRGRFAEAWIDLELFREFCESTPRPKDRFHYFFYLADYYNKTVLYKNAIGAVRSARSCWSQPGIVATTELYLVEAVALLGLERVGEARDILIRILDDVRADDIPAFLLELICNIAIDVGEAERSERVLRVLCRTQRTTQGPGVFYRLVHSWGRALIATGRLEKGISVLSGVAENLRGRGGGAYEDGVCIDLGYALEESGQLNDAEICYERAGQIALNWLSGSSATSRQLLISGRRYDVFFRLAEHQFLQENSESLRRGLSYVALGSGIEFVASKTAKERFCEDVTTVDDEESVVLALDEVAGCVFGGRSRIDLLSVREEKKFLIPRWRSCFDLAMNEVLERSTTVLQYAVFGEEVVCVVSTKGVIELIETGSTEGELDRAVARLRSIIESNGPVPAIERARKVLMEMVVLPIPKRFCYGKSVAVVATGSLGLVPFAYLVAGAERFESGVVWNLPSLGSLIRRANSGSVCAEGFLGIGAPLMDVRRSGGDMNQRIAGYPRASLTPLPYAEKEIRDAASHFKTSTILLGADATEARVRELAGSSCILHFATHGWSRPGAPLAFSGLALSEPPEGDSSNDDGVLSAMEILDLDLTGTELVILSACETATGKVQKNRGVLSLQRAFLAAGAKAVVGTLWKVDDEVCRDLMADFFDALAKGKSPAESLAIAQRKQKKRTPHPIHWAPWILTGVPD